MCILGYQLNIRQLLKFLIFTYLMTIHILNSLLRSIIIFRVLKYTKIKFGHLFISYKYLKFRRAEWRVVQPIQLFVLAVQLVYPEKCRPIIPLITLKFENV